MAYNALFATLLILLQTVIIVITNVVPQKSSTDFFTLSPTTHKEELLEHYGNFMLSIMNQSVDPCENFYEYACGNWKESPMLTEKVRNASLLQAIQQRIDEQVLTFLQNTTTAELPKNQTTATTMESTAELKAKQFFGSCMQQKLNLSLGYEHHLSQLDDRYAESPHHQNASNQSWIYLNFKSHYELFPLLPLKVHYNTATRKFDILLKVPSKVLATFNDEHLHNMTKDFDLAKDAEKQKEFLANFANLTQFERNLTQLAKVRNETEQLTLGEFLKVHKDDRLNWTQYFDLAFNGTQQMSWPILNQLDNVNDLVYYLEQTNFQLLQSYVQHRRLVKFYALWKTQVNQQPNSTTNATNLANECRMVTETFYNYALLPWFIRQEFDANRREDILNVAKNIRNTFYELLDQYTWLDDETRSQAKTKLAAMDILVGYTDDLQHRDLVDEAYSAVNMSSNWFENIEIMERNRAKLRLKSVDKALIPLLMPTRTVNAYYADFLNQAFITIGMSQWPLYHYDFPNVFKYAGIGNIVGHEMAHGFDSYCYQFNYDGKKLNWWSTASLRNFKERYRCLESQYNKFILLGMATNGTLTSGDNIADNVGVRMAYLAYKRQTANKGWQVKPLRGLNYNNKQLFFLKFAQSWCRGKVNPAKLQNKFKLDPHAYEEFRVLGTLNNMPEFSEAFNCKLGSDMNPLKKCVVW